MQQPPLRRQIPGERGSQNAPHCARAQEWTPRRPRHGGHLAAPGGTPSTRGPDRGRTAARTGQYGVKRAVIKRQRLAIRRHRAERRIVQPLTCTDQHGGRDIQPNDEASPAGDRKRRQGRLAGSGRDVKHPRTGGHFGSGKHRRDEQPRPAADIAVVGRQIRRPPRRDMQPGRKTGAHGATPASYLRYDHGRLSLFGARHLLALSRKSWRWFCGGSVSP